MEKCGRLLAFTNHLIFDGCLAELVSRRLPWTTDPQYWTVGLTMDKPGAKSIVRGSPHQSESWYGPLREFSPTQVAPPRLVARLLTHPLLPPSPSEHHVIVGVHIAGRISVKFNGCVIKFVERNSLPACQPGVV